MPPIGRLLNQAGAVTTPHARRRLDSALPTIDWTTEIIDPAYDGEGTQLCVEVRGADASWAQRFNEMAHNHYRRGEVRGGRWRLARYNEVEGHITLDDLYGDASPARQYLTELTASASDA